MGCDYNIDIRQRVAAVGRRVNTLCRGEESLRDQLVLFQTYHNFVVPHTSLRQPLPVTEATNGGSVNWFGGNSTAFGTPVVPDVCVIITGSS